MHRRSFLRTTGMTAAGLALRNRTPFAAGTADPIWRTFAITTRVTVRQPSGATRVWLPTPLAVAPYQRTMGDTYHPGSGTAVMIETNANEPDILGCSWDEGAEPVLTLVSRVATADHTVDLTAPSVAPPRDLSAFSRFLKPARLIPIDGIVRTTAETIVKGAGTDIERARAIYDWIVDHTFRDPKVIGCGTGDIRFMLESGNLGGKCADINALFVGLCRAVGIPARDVYGLRVADSSTWKSLGKSGDITKAQHCRAEFYHTAFGWVPVDPADVRKVILEEETDQLLPLADPRVQLARRTLFGTWEMNWLAFNTANDTRLAPEAVKALGHF